MKNKKAQIRKHLSDFNFQLLFMEVLGWDSCRKTKDISVADATYHLRSVAQKRGLVVWVCEEDPDNGPIDGATRKKIEARVAKDTRENLVIFTDSRQERQIWCWARREPGRPVSMREHAWYSNDKNETFLEKLDAITFSIEEEEELNLFNVTSRVRAVFNVEKVTKKFFSLFQKKHEDFLSLIEGIDDDNDRKWYASLMLNRLMFIYFMQQKKFFDGDRNYLQTQLNRCKKEKEKGGFYSFYRNFLLRLFHEGLGGKARSQEIDNLLGKVPYLNGGLFEEHPVEKRCPDIHIPDKAFDCIFTYFEKYQWRLDERPLREGNEINPDILGYIFEKHINQKEMGAYYTQEDVTEYISRNSILPRLLEMVKSRCEIAFVNPEGGGTVWNHLSNDPNRYIYPSIQHGTSLPLPDEIAAGIDDVSARSKWNDVAPSEFALPNETWREVLERRGHYEQTHSKLLNGQVSEINNLVTLNLDTRQFVQDIIERCEGPELLRACWVAIRKITVLDPTCGSGAFLFAALNVLEPLYQACVERMKIFVEDLGDKRPKSKHLTDFQNILTEMSGSTNENYFILKNIILNNLFGVDIMEEAVEICKLRLFLKLAAQAEPDGSQENSGIESLPDIDFNIRAGNTLVGYATYASVERNLSKKLDLDEVEQKIARRVGELRQAFDLFRKQQLQENREVDAKSKVDLSNKLKAANDELNQWLALECGVNPREVDAYSEWLERHKPFHWFIEFCGIIERGGFDVIIGNPPYLDLKSSAYQPTGLEIVKGRAVHAMCIERSFQVIHSQGSMSMIVPLALTSSQYMQCVQALIEKGRVAWYSNYSLRPAHLFDQVSKRLTIFIAKAAKQTATFSTHYRRWRSENRIDLMDRTTYVPVLRDRPSYWVPKFGYAADASILAKLLAVETCIAHFVTRTENSNKIYYRSAGGGYWMAFTDFPPAFTKNGVPGHSSAERIIYAKEKTFVNPLVSALSSSLFWWWYTMSSDLFNVSPSNVRQFPLPSSTLCSAALADLSAQYLADLQKNSSMQVRNQKHTGTIETQTFDIAPSKKIIDEIDKVLGPIYGLSDEELEFIINYDINYRMGSDNKA